MATLDFTTGHMPELRAKVECPYCEEVIRLEGVMVGEVYEDEFLCPDCHRLSSVKIETSVVFSYTVKKE